VLFAVAELLISFSFDARGPPNIRDIFFDRMMVYVVLSVCTACDSNCASGCDIQGTGKCDLLCNDGWVLSSSSYQCLGK